MGLTEKKRTTKTELYRMKNLSLKNPLFEFIERSIIEWLDILGYSHHTIYNLPNHIRGFLYLEQNGIHRIKQLTVKTIRNYYSELKNRSNQRKSGGFKQCLFKQTFCGRSIGFSDYLGQSGKILLPALSIDWEANDSEEITILTSEEIKLLYKVNRRLQHRHRVRTIQCKRQSNAYHLLQLWLRRNEGYHRTTQKQDSKPLPEVV